MNKIIRIIEGASCSVLQAYYIAPSKYALVPNDFERYGDLSKVSKGFDSIETAESIAECFRQLDDKYETTSKIDIFDLEDKDKYPLPKVGPMFA